jgi:CysZ protein
VRLRFGALSLLVNLAVLAMRHLPFSEAVKLRRQRSFGVFIAGMIVAVFVAVPLLNLFTPLFATAFMTRMMKRVV